MWEFVEFLAAVFGRWQGWVSGGGFGGAVVVLLGFYERVTGWTMSRQMYIAIFLGAFLLGAFFLAWRDEHRSVAGEKAVNQGLRTELADLKNPNFSIELNGASVGLAEQRPNDSVVTLFVSVTNLGAPSVAREWRLSVTRPGAIQAISAVPIIPPLKGSVILARDKEPPVTIPATEELAAKTAQNPLTRGEARAGYLLFMVEGVSGTTLREEKITLTVTARDIRGHQYSVSKQMSGTPGAAPYVPGLPLR